MEHSKHYIANTVCIIVIFLMIVGIFFEGLHVVADYIDSLIDGIVKQY